MQTEGKINVHNEKRSKRPSLNIKNLIQVNEKICNNGGFTIIDIFF